MSGAKPCPVSNCISPVRPGQLMCLAHWRATPLDLQMAVNRTWRAYGHAGRSDPREQLKRLKAYRDARDAALAHHEQKVRRRG